MSTKIVRQSIVFISILLFVIGVGTFIFSPYLVFSQPSGGSGVTNPTWVYTLNVNDEYTLPTTDGSASQILQTDGAGTITWETNAAGFADPMSATGDIIWRAAGGTTRLPVGTDNYVLTVDGTDIGWEASSGGGTTQEQVDDWVDALINDADSVHTRITITYDDTDNAMDFVVDAETDPTALLTAGTDNVKDTHLDWGTGANQVSAVDIPIADAGVIITGTEVEAALQENRTAINLNTSKVTESTTVGDTASLDLTLSTYDITGAVLPAGVDHDSLSNFVANEHLDWTGDLGATNIHAGNYTDTDTTYTAGDALTLTGNDFDFDGGATPGGDLGGTWGTPSVDDDSHAHTTTTISGLNEADITDLAHTATAITDGLIIEPDLDADSAPSDADILTYDSTGTNFDWITPNAGTDITADLEEEAHCSEHDSTDVDCTGETIIVVDDQHNHTTATISGLNEADITDLAHTATAITDGLIIEPDLDADNAPVINDILTYDSTGTNFNWQTPLELSLQPLEATLTDIADGTIAENLVNTANPWAANEITEADPLALLTAGTDNVDDTHINWGAGAGQVDADDISDGSTNAIITLTQETNFGTAYTHSQNNAQEHTDYFLNTGADTAGAGSTFAWTFNAGATDPVFTFDSDSVVITNAATFTVDGVSYLADQTIGIADNNLLEVDDADAADNDFAKFTANGLEGRSYAETLSDIGAEVDLVNEAGLYAVLNDVTQFWEAGDSIPVSDVGASAADSTIALAGYEQTITSSLDEADHVALKIDHTDADVTAATTLFQIDSVDTADTDLLHFQIREASGGTPITIFSAGPEGLFVRPTSGANSVAGFQNDGGAGGVSVIAASDTLNHAGASFFGTKHRNTLADPRRTNTGDVLFRLGSTGAWHTDDVSTATVLGAFRARIQIAATEDWTATGHGNEMTFETTNIGATSQTGKLHLGDSGVSVYNGTTAANYPLQVNGAISGLEKTADPTEPAEGEFIIWMSDGTGKGDDGDILIASKAGGTTNYGTLFDHSGGSAW